MKGVSLTDQEYLVQKLVMALRAIPSYNQHYNGVRAEYGTFLTIIVTAPDDFPCTPINKYQLETIIYNTFKTYKWKASGFISYYHRELRPKNGLTYKRQSVIVIIRRLIKIEKGSH